jgi:hypothetical protein
MFQPTSLIANFDCMFSSQHLQTPNFVQSQETWDFFLKNSSEQW